MLTMDALRDRDVGRAIDELLVNATKLAVSGHADLAQRALGLLLEEGPWRLPAHGATQSRYQHLLPLVCGLADRECPAVGDRPAMSAQDVKDWAAEQAFNAVLMCLFPRARQLGPAGSGWSAEYLESLPSQMDVREPQRHRAFGRFCVDAEILLRQRLTEQPSIQTLTEALTQELPSLGVDPALLNGTAEIAPEAAGIDSLDIMRAIGRYLEVTGFAGGYLEPLFSCAWVSLLEQGRASDAVEVAEIWLRQDLSANRCMLGLSGLPSANDLIRSGGLARINRIVEGMGEAWLYYLGTRPLPPPPRPAKPARRKVHARTRSLRGLRAALKGTPIADLDWIAAAVDESPGEIAFIARLRGLDPMAAWQSARDLCDRTGRWPVLCCDLDPEQYFSRSEYQQGPAADDVSPAAIIAAAEAVDLPAFLATLEDNQLTADDWLQIWAHEWKALGLPTDDLESLWIESGQNRLRCEHLLAKRERERGITDPQRGRPTCHPPEQIVLMLLPTTEGPDALAYMHWFGMGRGRPEGFVRMLQSWSERYGAELYTHYTTTLEFKVSRPPTDLETALDLAREHELVAPATLILPGIALRHYAEGLIDHPIWFLHERP